MEKIIIIGATSAMAEHCARIWVTESPKEMLLLGRDKEKTERVAHDLRVRSPNSIVLVNTIDFLDPIQIYTWVGENCTSRTPDIVLIAHGSLPDQQVCQQNLVINHDVLELNGISPVLFAEAFVGHMERVNKGKVAIIGSVAGDRGRKSNYVYGAAKGLVTRYIQGLQHRVAGSGVYIVLIKPGPTDTPMTSELKRKGARLAEVETVASAIVKGINRSQRIVYAPKKWGILMMIIRHLPSYIFNKLHI